MGTNRYRSPSPALHTALHCVWVWQAVAVACVPKLPKKADDAAQLILYLCNISEKVSKNVDLTNGVP